MEPGGTVRGRLVDRHGRPWDRAELSVSFRPKGTSSEWRHFAQDIETDREGRFSIKALLPGYEYHLWKRKGEFTFGEGLRSGETKDLGDVQMKGPQETNVEVSQPESSTAMPVPDNPKNDKLTAKVSAEAIKS